jgi:hypothetical protein
VSATSKAIHEARSNASHTNSGGTTDTVHESLISSTPIGETFQETLTHLSYLDQRGNIMPKTPEAALVAAQAYLYTT